MRESIADQIRRQLSDARAVAMDGPGADGRKRIAQVMTKHGYELLAQFRGSPARWLILSEAPTSNPPIGVRSLGYVALTAEGLRVTGQGLMRMNESE